MQRRNLTLLCCAALLGVVAALVWWPLASDPPPPAPVHPAAPGPGEPPPDPTAQPLALPADAPRVVVAVRELFPYVPPVEPRLAARGPGSPAILPAAAIAGLGANPFGEAPRAGLSLAAIDLGAGVRLLRQVDVAAVEPTEVVLGPRTVVRGTVTDDQRRPVAGARVSLGELGGSGELREATTDADGRFELDVHAGEGVPLVVQAAAFAAQWRPVVVSAQGGNDFQIALPAAGVLEIQLACEARELDIARVFVVPHGAVTTELAHFPYFLQALTRGHAVDASGRAVVLGLPRQGTLGVVVLHPAAAIAPPLEVRLAGARTLAVAPLQVGTLQRWRVVDEQGLGVARALALLRPGGRAASPGASLRLLPPLLDAVGCALGFGDVEGVFAVGATAVAGSVLGLRAPGCAGVDLPFPAGGPGEPVVLPRWRGGEPSIRLLPPRAAGRWASEWDLSGGLRLVHEPGEAAVVALPRAGAYEVTVTTFVGGQARGARVYARLDATGPTDVEAPGPD